MIISGQTPSGQVRRNCHNLNVIHEIESVLTEPGKPISTPPRQILTPLRSGIIQSDFQRDSNPPQREMWE